jgi:transposase
MYNALSYIQAAEALGVSRNTVRRYWDGAHTPDEKRDYPAQIQSPQKECVMSALEA